MTTKRVFLVMGGSTITADSETGKLVFFDYVSQQRIEFDSFSAAEKWVLESPSRICYARCLRDNVRPWIFT